MIEAHRVHKTGQPRFIHDCEHCQYLGHYVGRDVYRCRKERTFVARRSDIGEDYVSFPRFVILQLLEDDKASGIDYMRAMVSAIVDSQGNSVPSIGGSDE